jgi:general secretion pathway protein E
MMTVEDPIEYDLDGVGQTQVNARIGMTFARALRAILRQDPDVIMIGEIRDLETAEIAVQASLTGHLVLATLHTNSAAGAVTRLVDMGIEPYLLASTLSGVLAQRLVRKVDRQDKSKFRGRTGIYELLTVNETIRSLIHDGESEAEIAVTASQAGMKTLREDGMRWVESGVTSIEEVIRVTRD